MKQLLKMTAAPATALFALAFVAMATPASAGDYCYTNTSGMRGCSFSTMEQCQAAVAGVHGNCYRDPFLPAASVGNAYASQPKHSKNARKPVENR